jgi:hypothetical protein
MIFDAPQPRILADGATPRISAQTMYGGCSSQPDMQIAISLFFLEIF